jgi:Flp pilus assembly protein TadG
MKRNLVFLTVKIVMLLYCQSTLSQDIATSNLEWQLVSTTDLATQQTKPYTGTIKTHAVQNIEWIQKGGEKQSAYTVTSTEGTWADTSKDGSYTYYATRNNNLCAITFERRAGETTVLMKFGEPGNPIASIRFLVQSITIN